VVVKHPERIWAMAVSPDGSQVASTDDSGRIIVSTIATSFHQNLDGHTDLVRSLQFSADGHWRGRTWTP